MAPVSSQIRIGIIGADSSHTVAFIKEFKKYPGYSVSWVDINNRTNLDFSITRSIEIIRDLKTMNVFLIDDLENAEEVDAYCILTLDANTHSEILKIINDYKKPIFIDKPIFYDLKHFDGLPELIFSSSALRYTDFVQKAKLENKNSLEVLRIEGPLSFIEGIEGYFWYGIHLVEILHTLSDSRIEIHDYVKYENYEVVNGVTGSRKFTLKGITVGNPEFRISIGSRVYSINDDHKNVYENLVEEVLEFFDKKETSINGKNVIDAVIKINERRSHW